MNSFFDWYLELNFFNKVLFMCSIIIGYNFIKSLVVDYINKRKNKETIFKGFYIARITLEVIVCSFCIWIAILAYSVSQAILTSLFIGVLPILLVLANHKFKKTTVQK